MPHNNVKIYTEHINGETFRLGTVCERVNFLVFCARFAAVTKTAISLLLKSV